MCGCRARTTRACSSGGAFGSSVRSAAEIFSAYVVWAMVAGPDLVNNPVFGVFYVGGLLIALPLLRRLPDIR